MKKEIGLNLMDSLMLIIFLEYFNFKLYPHDCEIVFVWKYWHDAPQNLSYQGREDDIACYRSTADIENVIDLKMSAVQRGEMGVAQFIISRGEQRMMRIKSIGSNMCITTDME